MWPALQATTCLPSPTKASLYGAILFTLQQSRWLPVSKASLIFLFTMFMVSCKVRHPGTSLTLGGCDGSWGEVQRSWSATSRFLQHLG